MISKDNVEAIYSMEPPGRFLKKCADTGQWKELSEKEAMNKAAQAMAYLVIIQEKKKHKTQHSHSHHSSSRRSNTTSCAMPSQLADCQQLHHFQNNHHSASSIVPASMSSSSGVRRQWGEGTTAGNGGGQKININIPRDDELLPHKFSLHHELREMQQSRTTLSGDESPQSQTKARHQHQQRQRQLHHEEYQMGRHEQNELLIHTRLPPSSRPPTQSSIAPVHRAAMLRNLISTAVGKV